jgi:hypothetical protein
MARQLYMGLGLLFSEATWSCAVVAVGDRHTGSAVRLDPD